MTVNTDNTSVHMDDTTVQTNETDANNPETAEKEKKASNASFARKRIAERNARKAIKTEVAESELDPDEEEMINKSSVGKRTRAMEQRLEEMEERTDADEVAREVEKFVKNHEYNEYLDVNALTSKALDPKYSELELDEIAWLQLKDKMPEIYGEQRKKAEKKIAETALPSSAGNSDDIENLSLKDYEKNRHAILERYRK